VFAHVAGERTGGDIVAAARGISDDQRQGFAVVEVRLRMGGLSERSNASHDRAQAQSDS
jgi:hypothetical protein